MPLHRVFSGPYRCPECDAEFRADRADDEELTCPDCEVDLVEEPATPDEEEDEEEGEEEEAEEGEEEEAPQSDNNPDDE